MPAGLLFCRVQKEVLAVVRHCRRTVGPKGLDFVKPPPDLAAKEAIRRIFSRSELLRQAASAEERNAGTVGVQRPRLPRMFADLAHHRGEILVGAAKFTVNQLA